MLYIPTNPFAINKKYRIFLFAIVPIIFVGVYFVHAESSSAIPKCSLDWSVWMPDPDNRRCSNYSSWSPSDDDGCRSRRGTKQEIQTCEIETNGQCTSEGVTCGPDRSRTVHCIEKECHGGDSSLAYEYEYNGDAPDFGYAACQTEWSRWGTKDYGSGCRTRRCLYKSLDNCYSGDFPLCDGKSTESENCPNICYEVSYFCSHRGEVSAYTIIENECGPGRPTTWHYNGQSSYPDPVCPIINESEEPVTTTSIQPGSLGISYATIEWEDGSSLNPDTEFYNFHNYRFSYCKTDGCQSASCTCIGDIEEEIMLSTDRLNRIDDLDPYTEYTVSVNAIFCIENQWFDSRRDKCIGLGATDNITFVAGANPGEATINWNAVYGALTYDLQYKTTGAGDWTELNDISTTSSGLITGLTPGTQYTFRVRAKNGNYTGEYYQEVYNLGT